MKHEIKNIDKELPKEIELFICCNGKTSRWNKILLNSKCIKSKKIYVINNSNVNSEEVALGSCIEMINAGQEIKIINIFDENPIKQWELLYYKITHVIKHIDGNCVVDITEFPKDLIYSTVLQLKYLDLSHKVTFIYSSADSYSISIDSLNDTNVNELQSVLGYSGDFTASNSKSHLIILVGFDSNLAIKLIKELEPSSISLGVGIDAYKQEFYVKNLNVKEKIESYIKLNSFCDKVSTFNFSCSDCNSAKNDILEEAKKYEDKNIMLCALNTKVASVSAALAVIENNSIRLCHVEPIFKEYINYSTSSETVSIFNI